MASDLNTKLSAPPYKHPSKATVARATQNAKALTLMEAIGSTLGLERLILFLQLINTLMKAPTQEFQMLASACYAPTLDARSSGRIHKGFDYLLTELTGDIRLSVIAQKLEMSEPGFSRFFKRVAGHGFIDLMRKLRVQRARRLLAVGILQQEGWSITQDYCTVDPCDPGTAKPENVMTTAQNYRKIDPGKVAGGQGLGAQAHFFRSVRIGVARFVPDEAIYANRALANEVLGRDGYVRRQGVLELVRHSASLTKDLALRFLSAGVSSTASHKDGKVDRNEFLTAQFSILIALPHLTADEQFDAIANLQGDTFLLELLPCVRRATPEKVEHVLQRILQCGNEHAQTAVLASIHCSKSQLTPRSAAIVKGFVRSPLKTLRHEALALAASSSDVSLLQEVVDSGWSAEKPGNRNSVFEEWHGSTAILKALQLGLIEMGTALDRMNMSHYGFAAETLVAGGQAGAIAARIEAALVKALDYDSDVELPDIETGAPKASDLTPPLISLTERTASENDFASQMRRFSETDEQFDERQRRMNDAYERFAGELTDAEADLILSDLTFDGINAIIGQDADRGQRWLRMLVATSDRKLRHLHHVALQVAVAIGVSGNPLAPDFVTRLLALAPTIRRVTGAAKIPVEAIILWSNTTNPAVVDICRRRLRTPRSDSDIAREVIAAHLCAKVPLLQTYIDELLTTDRPYETALALMIAGFCDESVHAAAVLSRFNGTKGFIGAAHTAASDSYARNIWAKTWYAEMQNSL